MDVEAALEYARKHQLEAVLIEAGGKRVAEEYGSGLTAEKPHPLFSGTKSFWGVAALYAQRDGILSLDDPVAGFPGVTLRMLLNLTAGFGFGGLGSAVPTYDRALDMQLKNAPGTKFTYGGIPLQVFGAVFARKLERRKQTPHEYLRERVLEPAGVTVSSWRTLTDGTQPLPTGAFLTADNWLTYGRYVLQHRDELAECFVGSSANARYGLGWWLGLKGCPEDLFYASGSGGQGMYVVPSLNAVAVHFGKGSSYSHDAFAKRVCA